MNTHAVEVQFSNTAPGSLKLQKISENAELVKDNVCYTLEGAEYGIYASQEDALADQNRIDILRTDADGNTNIVTLHAGTYYIKEITASAGYLLCNENDVKLYGWNSSGSSDTKETTQIVCTEVPGNTYISTYVEKNWIRSFQNLLPCVEICLCRAPCLNFPII